MKPYLTNTSGAKINGVVLTFGNVLTLRCYVPNGTAECLIYACRADFVESSPTGESARVAALHGQELLNNGSIQGKTGAGAWQNIAGFSNALSLGAITAGNYEEFEIRITEDSGKCAFAIAVGAEL